MLRSLILRHELVPGQRLNEVDLASQLQISRGPLRESLQHLEAEGLVTIASHKGTYVRTFTPGELSELYEVRMIIETAAVSLAAERRTASDLKSAERLLEVTKREFDKNSVYPLQHDFHHQILVMAHNTIVLHQGQMLLRQLALARAHSSGHAQRSICALEEHKEIVTAIKAADGNWASRSMRSHLESSFASAENIFKEQPR